MIFTAVADQLGTIFVWGTIATAAMTSLMEGGQLLGFSRLSLPFLFGTAVTGRRDLAIVLGFILYAAGAFLFAFFYAFAFEAIGLATWWTGAVMGLIHGLFLITVFFPLLPYIHPRMATAYDGPTVLRRLEPPGPFGLNYGRSTPIITLIGQTIYGVILGATYVVD